MTYTRRLTAVAAAVMVFGSVPVVEASVAHAGPETTALNGVFSALSDGQWATTNERYHDEATVASRWTIETTCQTFQDCRGTVSSDLGWTADITFQSNVWKVVRTLDGWEPCPDGISAAGRQIYKFWNDPDHPGRLAGWDTTTGPSGACDVNRTLVVELPFRLTPV